MKTNTEHQQQTEDNIIHSFKGISEKAEQQYPGINELIQVYSEYQKSLQLHRQAGYRSFFTTSSNASFQ